MHTHTYIERSVAHRLVRSKLLRMDFTEALVKSTEGANQR